MAIICKEAYFNSSTGKNKIRSLIWQDDKVTPIAVLQIAHGVSEHIGRYDEFARFMVNNGFIVCGNDHIGHGKSVDTIADLGHTTEEKGHIRMVDDMHILHNIMHKRYPELPYFLFGHSMGSFAARLYATSFGKALSGLILCGTGQLPSVLGLMKNPIEKIVEKIGNEKNAGAMMKLFGKFSSFNFRDEKDELAWLSRDLDNRMQYRADPLAGADLKASGIRDLVALAVDASSSKWAISLPLYLPIMLISGADDPIGMNGKGVLAVSDALELAGIEPTVILYPQDRHEILNEIDREKVFNDVLNWLQSVINGAFCL